LNTPEGRAVIDLSKRHLAELLAQVDCLTY
jgi:hypothetical protein